MQDCPAQRHSNTFTPQGALCVQHCPRLPHRHDTFPAVVDPDDVLPSVALALQPLLALLPAHVAPVPSLSLHVLQQPGREGKPARGPGGGRAHWHGRAAVAQGWSWHGFRQGEGLRGRGWNGTGTRFDVSRCGFEGAQVGELIRCRVRRRVIYTVDLCIDTINGFNGSVIEASRRKLRERPFFLE